MWSAPSAVAENGPSVLPFASGTPVVGGVTRPVPRRGPEGPTVGACLRRRRESLRPRDVGLVEGPRRRTSGLRREEVAHLAGMSTDYYARLEQQRAPQSSVRITTALARALRLTLDERDHLFVLIGHNAPARLHRSEHVAPTLPLSALRTAYAAPVPR
ncbi:helix-turn-helix domain protein [Actinobacteria bacterium OK074]|nr:helix-turn-helix domain protein [Actinobacteria bacterium OK074]